MDVLIIEDFLLQQKLLSKMAKDAGMKYKVADNLSRALDTIKTNQRSLAWILDWYFPCSETSLSSIYDPNEVRIWIEKTHKDLLGKNIEGTYETAMWSVLIRVSRILWYYLPGTIILNSAEKVANEDMVKTLDTLGYNGKVLVSNKPEIENIKRGLVSLQ